MWQAREYGLDSRPSESDQVQPDHQKKTISEPAIDHSPDRRKSDRLHQMHQGNEQNPRQIIFGKGWFSLSQPAFRRVVM